MKIGFICPTVPGHLNPMTVLARHLQARNHEVVFLYSSSANGLLEIRKASLNVPDLPITRVSKPMQKHPG
jgi:UDP:flavonoid glycosyltransferase YjiC (YdhE family)